MNEKSDNRPTGGIEPFKSRSDKNTENESTDRSEKDIRIEPVNQEELSMLLSEPTGYADIVKQIRKDTISQNKDDQHQKSADIPEYDLGKQMLAAHRRNTAAKRGAPGQKVPIPIKSIPSPEQKLVTPAKSAVTYPKAKPAPTVDIKQAPSVDIQSEAIIREIVARDIARLCRCNLA